MAITPNFTASVNFSSPRILSLTDTSTGTDGTLTTRRVYLQKADGTYLVPTGTTTNYIVWNYAVSFIDIDVLDIDYALSIEIRWMAGSTEQYTDSKLFDFTTYSENFYYQLTQYQSSIPKLVDDSGYYLNKLKLRVCIDEANQAISLGGDVKSSQAALDRAKYLIDNQTTFF